MYITTAINYTNGPPHIGHAYEIICADIIARFHKLYNKHVYFSTGTDEHGQKIKDTAKNQNITPIALCDYYVNKFKQLNESLNIGYDVFIRTTDQKYKDTVLMIWNKLLDQGDIYLGYYKGWYNVREEKYVSLHDATKCQFMDTLSNKPLIQRKCSYFFKLSQYRNG